MRQLLRWLLPQKSQMTESTYPIKPLLFSSNPGSVKEDGDEIVVPRALLNVWIDQFPPGQPMLAYITCMDTGLHCLVCIGCDDGTAEYVFAPNWILARLGLSFDTEASVTLLPCFDELPMATHIAVRLDLDPGQEVDGRQLLETHLDMFHILEEGTVLPIPFEGQTLYTTVVRIEPGPRARLGGEVLLELLSAHTPVGPSPHFPAVITAPTGPPEPVVFPSVVPSGVGLTSEEIRLARIRRFASPS